MNRIAANSFLGVRGSVNQIGVPITTDSNLPTIPESDTASVRLSILSKDAPNDSAAIDDAMNADARSQGSSRASTDLSAAWYLSPKERLGLGGFIKHNRKDTPWVVPGKEDEDYVMSRGSISPSDERDRIRRKSAWKGVFKSK